LPAERLAGALAEADLLLAKAHALGRPTLAGTDRLADPADLVPPDVGAEFAARLLDPLHRLDRADLLLDTLRTWLAQHGGWDRTAAALGVHRNSVRHRIGQIERALEVDLADPEVRMRLWFALRWAREDSDRLG
jgi:DNA-binding PucR family transcriptional regulator